MHMPALVCLQSSHDSKSWSSMSHALMSYMSGQTICFQNSPVFLFACTYACVTKYQPLRLQAACS